MGQCVKQSMRLYLSQCVNFFVLMCAKMYETMIETICEIMPEKMCETIFKKMCETMCETICKTMFKTMCETIWPNLFLGNVTRQVFKQCQKGMFSGSFTKILVVCLDSKYAGDIFAILPHQAIYLAF